MKKKINIKDVLLICVATLLLAALIIGLTGSSRTRSQRSCTGIEVEISDTSNKFLTEKEILGILNRDFGGYVNRPVDSINLFKMENILYNVGRIREDNVYFTSDGILHVKLAFTEPVIKIMSGEKLYYLDEEGRHYPINNDWKPGLICIDGHPPIGDRLWMERMSHTAAAIKSMPEWNGRIEEMNCDSKGELSLRLKDREETFRIGVPREIGKKLSKIDIYLTNILPRLEEGKGYSTVNLKYNGQIVCK